MNQVPAHKVKLQDGTVGALYSSLQPQDLINQEVGIELSGNAPDKIGIVAEVLESKMCDIKDML